MPGPNGSGPQNEPVLIDTYDDFWVVDKPPGWTVQRSDNAPSILSWLIDVTGEAAFPVHRLDKLTSGLLLVARTKVGNQQLSRAFAERAVTKVYAAISRNKPSKKQGWVKGDMSKSRRGQWKLLRSQTNPAVTYFRTESIAPSVRGFYLYPHSGKTHQLRVAMKALGSPILGDTRYGGDSAERMHLHAWSLSLTFNNQPMFWLSQPAGGIYDQWLLNESLAKESC